MRGPLVFSKLTREFTPERRPCIDETKREAARRDAAARASLGAGVNPASYGEATASEPASHRQLEQRADVYVSGPRSYIAPVGGKLTIVAEFPDGEIDITSFSNVGVAEGTQS